MYYLSTATFMYLQTLVNTVGTSNQLLLLLCIKIRMNSSLHRWAVGVTLSRTVRRITASWGSLILKIWATLRGTRMPLILKI